MGLTDLPLDYSSHYVVGLMSGTSLDGVDAALVKISEADDSLKVEPVHFSSLPFTPKMKEKLLQLCVPATSKLEDLSSMNFISRRTICKCGLKSH